MNFVRPAHGLVALHGAEIVPVSVLGLTAGRETQGHRFESSIKPDRAAQTPTVMRNNWKAKARLSRVLQIVAMR